MDDRTKTFGSFFVLAAAVTAAGCGFNQQNRFQTSFLPSVPHATVADSESLPPPPAIEPNKYLEQAPPAFLLASAQILPRKTSGDAIVLRAEQTFQHGKRNYQSNDFAGARRDFDAAIDLMLQASEEQPGDREEYNRKLDEMVDAIHRFDLAGMGASVRTACATRSRPPSRSCRCR